MATAATHPPIDPAAAQAFQQACMSARDIPRTRNRKNRLSRAKSS